MRPPNPQSRLPLEGEGSPPHFPDALPPIYIHTPERTSSLLAPSKGLSQPRPCSPPTASEATGLHTASCKERRARKRPRVRGRHRAALLAALRGQCSPPHLGTQMFPLHTLPAGRGGGTETVAAVRAGRDQGGRLGWQRKDVRGEGLFPPTLDQRPEL